MKTRWSISASFDTIGATFDPGRLYRDEIVLLFLLSAVPAIKYIIDEFKTHRNIVCNTLIGNKLFTQTSQIISLQNTDKLNRPGLAYEFRVQLRHQIGKCWIEKQNLEPRSVSCFLPLSVTCSPLLIVYCIRRAKSYFFPTFHWIDGGGSW